VIRDSKAVERASDLAYRAIKNAIVKREFPNGMKLSKRAMAEYCGVSIIPVIDALNRLESEGLVESNPYYGSRVVEISEKKVDDAYLLREAIETQVVRVLCFTIGIDEINILKKLAVEVDAQAGKQHDSAEYDDRHYEFHFTMAQFTRSDLLLDTLEKIHLFNLLAKSEERYLRQETIVSDFSHLDIVNALAKRNANEAERIIRNHIYRSQATNKPLWLERD
jgi:DNA-binding GntR family transcriptional regulator